MLGGEFLEGEANIWEARLAAWPDKRNKMIKINDMILEIQ